ncbi:MAG: rhomboid family intramembrane serine protease [Sphingomicrobium sp.]
MSVLWLLVAVIGASDRAPAVMGFIPARLSGTLELSPAVPALLTPLTATFVHGSFFHLLFNMIMLLWCGTAVERVLGRGALVLLYVVGAYTSAMAQWAVDPHSVVPMIGASGAISAVIGAFALSFGRPKTIVRSAGLNRTLNALWLLAAWIVLQLMMGVLAGGQGLLLATPAHIGGFIAGLLMQRPLLLWRYRNA